MARGGVEGGGNYYSKYFHRRGAIIEDRWLIEGWPLSEEIRYVIVL